MGRRKRISTNLDVRSETNSSREEKQTLVGSTS